MCTVGGDVNCIHEQFMQRHRGILRRILVVDLLFVAMCLLIYHSILHQKDTLCVITFLCFQTVKEI
jgi:hypothetical protein